MMTVLTKGPIPLYYQIEKILRDQVLSHQIPVGSQLPTEMDLCEKFQVSRATVRRALQSLESDGLIKCEQGRGTTVLPRHLECLFGTLQGPLPNHLHMDDSTRLTILSKNLVAPSKAVRADMKLDKEDKVFLFLCLRFNKSEGGLKIYSRIYLPWEVGVSIDTSQPEKLLQQFKKTLHKSAHRIREYIRFDKADEIIARHLEIDAGEPTLRVKRVYYSPDATVLLRAVSFFPGPHYELNTEVIMPDATA